LLESVLDFGNKNIITSSSEKYKLVRLLSLSIYNKTLTYYEKCEKIQPENKHPDITLDSTEPKLSNYKMIPSYHFVQNNKENK
jgi:hypothetical protein